LSSKNQVPTWTPTKIVGRFAGTNTTTPFRHGEIPAGYESSLNSTGWKWIFPVFAAHFRTVLEDANMKLPDAAVRNAKANGKVQKLSEFIGFPSWWDTKKHRCLAA